MGNKNSGGKNFTEETNEMKKIEIFQKASEEGNLPILQQILLQQPDLIHMRIGDDNPLIIACVNNYISIVEYLLSFHEIGINKGDRSGYTALHWTSRHGHSDCMKVLLKHPAIDVNSKAWNGLTALHFAANGSQIDCIRLLVNHPKISVNLQDEEGFTALHRCCQWGNIESIQLLIAHPQINLHLRNTNQETIFDVCSEGPSKSIILDILQGKLVQLELNQTISSKENSVTSIKLEPSVSLRLPHNAESGSSVSSSADASSLTISNSLTTPRTLLPRSSTKDETAAQDYPQQFDVFLTHDWGTPETNYQNHRNVARINLTLQSYGIRTWFDEDRMEGNEREQMTSGIDSSHCVIVFITERYSQKISTKNSQDNCYFEFNFATQHFSSHRIIPVVMESSMKESSQWSRRLAAEVGGNLYIDMSNTSIFPPATTTEGKTAGGDPSHPSESNRNEGEASLFDIKCFELVKSIYKVLTKSLKELTKEQTIIFLQSLGCDMIQEILQEKRITITGEDLFCVEEMNYLSSLLGNDFPVMKLRRIFREIQQSKENRIQMMTLLPFLQVMKSV